ncbi:MAG TPA: hypothetical protein VN932_12075 [Rhizomicrobium sp.]|nr:hypothetical protein [Rhizomicrobium sp.]
MQISGNNLLVASQQLRPPQPAKPPVAEPKAADVARQSASPVRPQRLGAQLDINV